MIRLLIFLLWIVFFAGLLTLVMRADGRMPIEAFGWRVDAPAGLIVIGLALISGAVLVTTSFLKDLAGAPKAARARKALARRDSGLASLARAHAAIASGDSASARREAQAAARALGNAPAAKHAMAEAAALSPDASGEDAATRELLNDPDTEILALRSLFARARHAGDIEAAQSHAARAFELKPGAAWAFDAALDLALARGDFAGAADAIDRAEKAGGLAREGAARGRAAALTGAAFAANAASDPQAALDLGMQALKLAPGLVPAAVLVARLEAAAGDARRAEKTLASAFARSPDRALVEAALELGSGEADGAAAPMLEKLAAKHPGGREAKIAIAQAHLLRGEAADAADLIADLLKDEASARVLAMMAEAKALADDEAAAKFWLLRAARAPRAPDLPAAAYFQMDGDGWRRLIGNYMANGALAPAPLEGRPPGLSEADFAAIPPAIAISEELPGPRPQAAIDQSEDDIDPAAAAPELGADEVLERDAAAARSVS